MEVHFHDDFDLGSANTIIALAAGADVAHTTISSIGERAGNAGYEEVALSLLTMYDVDLGLKYHKMYELASYLKEISGLKMRPNPCITGETLNQIESGIISQWYKNTCDDAPLELAPYLPELIGHPQTEVVLGKCSGAPSVDIYLEKLGMAPLESEQKLEVIAKIKELAYQKKGLVTTDEFRKIVQTVQ